MSPLPERFQSDLSQIPFELSEVTSQTKQAKSLEFLQNLAIFLDFFDPSKKSKSFVISTKDHFFVLIVSFEYEKNFALRENVAVAGVIIEANSIHHQVLISFSSNVICHTYIFIQFASNALLAFLNAVTKKFRWELTKGERENFSRRRGKFHILRKCKKREKFLEFMSHSFQHFGLINCRAKDFKRLRIIKSSCQGRGTLNFAHLIINFS
jgi:hypothetical protein